MCSKAIVKGFHVCMLAWLIKVFVCDCRHVNTENKKVDISVIYSSVKIKWLIQDRWCDKIEDRGVYYTQTAYKRKKKTTTLWYFVELEAWFRVHVGDTCWWRGGITHTPAASLTHFFCLISPKCSTPAPLPWRFLHVRLAISSCCWCTASTHHCVPFLCTDL